MSKELVQNLEQAILDLFPSRYSCMVGEELKVTIEVHNLDQCNNNFSLGLKELYGTLNIIDIKDSKLNKEDKDTFCFTSYHKPGIIKVKIKTLENE
jgi:hypothetical protein